MIQDQITQDEITQALNKDAKIRAATIDFAINMAKNETLMKNLLIIINKYPDLSNKRNELIQTIKLYKQN